MLRPFVDFQTDTLSSLEGVCAFSEIYGLVRYFYPGPACALTDWERFVPFGIETVREKASQSDLASLLAGLFAPVAPLVEIASGEAPPPRAAWGNRSGTLRWQHRGPSTLPPFAFCVSSELFADAGRSFHAGCVYECGLPGGLRLRLPVELPLGEGGRCLPPEFPPADNLSVDTVGMRLSIVAIAWNAMRYFHPDLSAVAPDWRAVLQDALNGAARARREEEFYRVLLRLCSCLKDAHARPVHKSHDDLECFAPGLSWAWIEDRLVVTGTKAPPRVGFSASSDDIFSLAVGDVVTEIDGQGVAEAIAEASSLVSGSTSAWVRHQALLRLLSGPADRPLTLRVVRAAGGRVELKLPRASRLWAGPFKRAVSPARPNKIARIGESLWYVDLTRVNDTELAAAISRINEGRGVVFDLRGCLPPGELSLSALGHLATRRLTGPLFAVPVIERPGEGALAHYRQQAVIDPKEPHLKAPAVFLADTTTVSYAETFVAVIKEQELGEIVGQATAGALGAIVYMNLPCEYAVTWTGTVALSGSGARQHGQGIDPTVPVALTCAGVAAGRDEVLERARALLAPGS